MFQRLLSSLFLFAVLATACGANPEAELQEATSLAFAERFPSTGESVASCTATGYVAEFGIEGLRSEGIDQATLQTDPGSIDKLVGQAPDVVAGCIDLEERLAESLDAIDGELASGCVEAERLQEWPLIRVLLESEEELASTSGRGETQLIDAVRGCVSEQTFAELAGLDDPDKLTDVLIGDPFALSRWVGDQDRCVVSTIVATLGIERMDELQVTLDSPDLFKVADDLTDDDIEALVAALDGCDMQEQLRRAFAVDEEAIAPCLVDSIEADEIPKIVAGLLEGERITRWGRIAPIVEGCADDAVDKLYQPQDDVSEEVEAFVDEFVVGVNQVSPRESTFRTKCLAAGIRTVTDDDDFVLVTRIFSTETPSESDQYDWWDYMLGASEIITTCVTPWDRLAEDLIIAEIDADGYPCVRAELDPEWLKDLTDSFGPTIWGGDYSAWYRLELGFEEVGEAIAVCGTAGDVQRWERYMDLVFAAEEPTVGDF